MVSAEIEYTGKEMYHCTPDIFVINHCYLNTGDSFKKYSVRDRPTADTAQVYMLRAGRGPVSQHGNNVNFREQRALQRQENDREPPVDWFK